MAKINETIKNIASEFNWDDEQLLNKMATEPNLEFSPNWEFKEKVDAKLQKKIALAKEQWQEKQELAAVPTKLKWRFYITWFWYAVCWFLVLFLIWFCTDLFSGWTIKVPHKYTYLSDSEAFWVYSNLWNITKSYKNWVDEEIETEKVVVTEDDIWGTDLDRNIALKSVAYNTSAWLVSQEMKANLNAVEEASYDMFTILDKNVFFWQSYRFAYKNKLFPSLDTTYPIFKSEWVLIWENASNHVIKALKIWDVSFKDFSWLEISNFELTQNWDNWYNIMFSANDKKLSFYPNKTWQSVRFDGVLPTNKQILKAISKNLQKLWISTKNYWDGIVNTKDFDIDMWIIQIFYPFQIQWKSVWNPELQQQIWMNIAYDLNQQRIVSIIDIDIATYEASNYLTLDKTSIEESIEKWWNYYSQWALHENSTVVLFDDMEVIYLEKIAEDWTIFYVPGIKWTVSTSLEDYAGPKYIFQEIIK